MTDKLLGNKNTGSNLVFYGLLLLLFYPPFFRGLFFNQELLITHILTGLLFLAVLFIHSGNLRVGFFRSPIDYGAVGLLLIYIIAGFDAVYPRNAVKEALKMFNYVLIFYMAAVYARQQVNVRKILQALYFSGTGVALAGLLTAAGVLNIKDAVEGNRIYSTIQYPNTLASYLIAVFIIGLYLIVTDKNIYRKMVYSAANYILFLTFLGTQSRGAMLLLPVAVLLLLAGPIGKMRLPVFWELVKAGSVAAVVYVSAITNFSGNPTGMKVSWVAGGLAIAAVLSIIGEKLITFSDKAGIKRQYLVIGALGFVIAAIGSAVVFTPIGEKVMPAFGRITRISFQEASIASRGIFYKDAMKVIADNPVLGTGGSGWAGIYTQYRSYAYSSRLVHSHFLETLVEVGIVGFAFYLLVWIGFLFTAVRNVVRAGLTEYKFVNWAVLCSAVAVGMHSAVDFNLSLGAVSIFIWCLYGLARGMEEEGAKGKSSLRLPIGGKTVKGMIAAITLLFVIFSGVLYTGLKYGVRGVQLLKQGQVVLAEPLIEKAAKYDPLNADYKVALSHVWFAKAGTDRKREELEKALEYSEKALVLMPFSPDKHLVKGNIHLNLGQADEGVKEFEDALKLDPTSQRRYENLADIYLRAGEYYAYLGKKEKAKEYYKKAIGVPGMIEQQAKKMNLPDDVPLMKQYELKITENIKKIVSEAEAGLKKLETK